MSKKPSLAAIPKNQDRDMTVFLQSIKTVIEYLDKNGGGGGGTDTSTITGHVNRINEDQSKDIFKTVDEKLAVGNLLDILNGAITESELFIALGTKIDKITTNETAISAETQQRIAALLATNAAIALESQTRVTALGAQAQQISLVGTKTDQNTALIVDERNASTTRDSALSTRLTATEAFAVTGAARIGTLETADVNNKQALATAKTELRAEFIDGGKIKDTRDDNQPPQWYYDNYPQQVAKEFKRTTTIGLTGSTYTYLETTVRWRDASGGPVSQVAYTDDGKIYARGSSSVTSWGAWAQQESTAGSQARVDAAKLALNKLITANSAAINQESIARSTAVGAVASQTKTLQTTVNGQTASIQTNKSSIDGLKLNWSVKVDSNGVIGGIALAGGGGTIDFIVRASTFAVAGVSGSTVTPFVVRTRTTTIGGVSVPAGVYIEEGFIRNGYVDTLQIAGDAVVVPRVQHFPTEISFGNGNGVPNNTETYSFGNIRMNAMGGNVTIQLTLTKLNIYKLNPAGSIAYVHIDFMRGSTRFYRYSKRAVWEDNAFDLNSWVSIPTVVDSNPPLGSHVYSINIVFEYEGHPVTVELGARSIHLIGAKR